MARNIKADTSLNISKLVDLKNFSSDAEFARFVGVSPALVSRWRSRNTYDVDKIANAFPEVSISWLLSGEGPMLKEEKEKEEEYELLPRITEDKGRPYYDVDFHSGYNYALQFIELQTHTRRRIKQRTI